MNFFDHKILGNHLLQLCPKVVKHPVYIYILQDDTRSLQCQVKANCLISLVVTRLCIQNILCCVLNITTTCLLITCRHLSCYAYNFVCVHVFLFETQGFYHFCCIRMTLYDTKQRDATTMVSDLCTEGIPVESPSVYRQFLDL